MIERDDVIKLVVATMLAAVVLAVFAIFASYRAHAETRTRSYYDRSGSFAGSLSTRGNSTSYTDPRGHFSGSSIRNSNGTTSIYDGRGRFIGSTIDTSPRR